MNRQDPMDDFRTPAQGTSSRAGEMVLPSETSPAGDSHSRRSFLQIMAASLSLAGLAGCRWPRQSIYPFAHRPEGRIPGVPVEYATAMACIVLQMPNNYLPIFQR